MKKKTRKMLNSLITCSYALKRGKSPREWTCPL